METIVPRWEWRMFGTPPAAAEAAFAAAEPQGAKDSDELYLRGRDDRIVKIRDDLMDLKVLVESDAHGLQQWRPVMKATFPLARADVERVAEALGVSLPTPEATGLTLEDLLAELERAGSGVLPAPIHKHRVRFSIGGCTAEDSIATVEGRSIRTMAIESEDGEAVWATVRAASLAGYRNTSYARGLVAMLRGEPARYAVIDVGTNSVKLHIEERTVDGSWRTLADRAEVTRLGDGLAETGAVSDGGLKRTVDAIAAMAQDARTLDVTAIAAVGTAGLRQARDVERVLDAIEERSGIRVEVISGEEESRLAYLAVERALGPGRDSLVVFDTGGGSSQFTFGRAGEVEERFSVDVGAVRLTERFGLDRAVAREVVYAALAAIAAGLSRLEGRTPPHALVGMGGAVTNLTAVSLAMAEYDADRVQGSVLAAAEVERQIEEYRQLDAEGRRRIVGLQPKRAEVILAGACIVRTVMRLLGADQLAVSDRGLRHGLLLERFGT